MFTTKRLAWLGGLIEGEGSFMLKNGSPSIQLQMTDIDVIKSAAELFDTKVSPPYQPKGKPTYKPVFKCSVHGTRAVGWMLTLFSFMGQRRRAKITEVVTEWKNSKAFPRSSRGTRAMALCHPDKVRIGHGLCKPCYMRQWRAV